MNIPLFKTGEIVRHKTGSSHRIVILTVKKRLFNWQQTYKVCWYEGPKYIVGSAFECELKEEA